MKCLLGALEHRKRSRERFPRKPEMHSEACASLASWQTLSCAPSIAARLYAIGVQGVAGWTDCGKPEGGWGTFVPSYVNVRSSRRMKRLIAALPEMGEREGWITPSINLNIDLSPRFCWPKFHLNPCAYCFPLADTPKLLSNYSRGLSRALSTEALVSASGWHRAARFMWSLALR